VVFAQRDNTTPALDNSSAVPRVGAYDVGRGDEHSTCGASGDVTGGDSRLEGQIELDKAPAQGLPSNLGVFARQVVLPASVSIDQVGQIGSREFGRVFPTVAIEDGKKGVVLPP